MADVVKDSSGGGSGLGVAGFFFGLRLWLAAVDFEDGGAFHCLADGFFAGQPHLFGLAGLAEEILQMRPRQGVLRQF